MTHDYQPEAGRDPRATILWAEYHPTPADDGYCDVIIAARLDLDGELTDIVTVDAFIPQLGDNIPDILAATLYSAGYWRLTAWTPTHIHGTPRLRCRVTPMNW